MNRHGYLHNSSDSHSWKSVRHFLFGALPLILLLSASAAHAQDPKPNVQSAVEGIDLKEIVVTAMVLCFAYEVMKRFK